MTRRARRFGPRLLATSLLTLSPLVLPAQTPDGHLPDRLAQVAQDLGFRVAERGRREGEPEGHHTYVFSRDGFFSFLVFEGCTDQPECSRRSFMGPMDNPFGLTTGTLESLANSSRFEAAKALSPEFGIFGLFNKPALGMPLPPLAQVEPEAFGAQLTTFTAAITEMRRAVGYAPEGSSPITVENARSAAQAAGYTLSNPELGLTTAATDYRAHSENGPDYTLSLKFCENSLCEALLLRAELPGPPEDMLDRITAHKAGGGFTDLGSGLLRGWVEGGDGAIVVLAESTAANLETSEALQDNLALWHSFLGEVATVAEGQ